MPTPKKKKQQNSRQSYTQSELLIRILPEFCSGGGFIRDIILILDKVEERRLTFPCYDRSPIYRDDLIYRYPASDNPCAECGRARCCLYRPSSLGTTCDWNLTPSEWKGFHDQYITLKNESAPDLGASFEKFIPSVRPASDRPKPGAFMPPRVPKKGQLQRDLLKKVEEWRQQAKESGWPANVQALDFIGQLEEYLIAEPP